MPEYFVKVVHNDADSGANYESAQKAYASSEAEAAKIVESRVESRGIPGGFFEYKAYEVSEDGTIQGFEP